MMSQKQSSCISAIQVNAAGGSHRGRVREHNEDTIALHGPSNPMHVERLGYLYLLADGVGGHAAGEIASRLAVETIASVYYDPNTFHELVADDASSSNTWKYSQDEHEDITASDSK